MSIYFTLIAEHEKVEYTKLRARPATKLTSGRPVPTSNY